MVRITFEGRVGQSLGALGTGIDQAKVIDGAGDPVIVGLSAQGGGLVTLDFAANGQARVADTQYLSRNVWANATGTLELIPGATGTFAVVAADGSDELVGHSIRSGQIASSAGVSGDNLAVDRNGHYQMAESGYLFAAAPNGTLRCFRLDENGTYRAGQVTRDTDVTFHDSPGALATLRIASKEFLVTACHNDAGLSVYEIDAATGHLSHTGSLGTATGLGLLDTPVALETVAAGAGGFVILATRSETGSSAALSVIELSADGQPRVADHILDGQLTRFGAVSGLQVVTHDGWTYVTVAGGDQGVSLFALTPTGLLVHLETMTSSLAAPIDSVASLSATVAGGDLQMLFTTHTETGFTQLSAGLSGQGRVLEGGGLLQGGTLNDMLIGTSSGSILRGGAGDDILDGGAGQDTLYGGAGADLFLIGTDGVRDMIGDFDPLADRLDFSAVSMLYSMEQIDFASRPWGAELSVRGEVLELRSASGNALSRAQVAQSIQWTTDRPPLVLRQEQIGQSGNDELFGHVGWDLIEALDGNDTLHGYAGDDDLRGGNGFDTLYAGDGFDTVYGGNGRDLAYLGPGHDLFVDNGQGGDLGRDTVFGGSGADTIEGGNGDDAFHGEWDNDVINGRLGNDSLYGGDGFDTLYGGDGRDLVYGGNGRDLAYLGPGHDLFVDNGQGGELGRDTVFGGFGADTIEGGNGDDVFHGEWDNDVINGRLGNDSLYGGDGFDTLYGGDGRDLVYGGNGRDRVYLGAGQDTYVDTAQAGELGRDTINGGAGADSFVFAGVMSRDVIVDFEPGVDMLQLSRDLWEGWRSPEQVVSDFARITSDGVLLEFGAGQSILLEGLTSTDGLADDLVLA
ncbi:calcium-binding protein [Pseudoponticoccus marisrubri]|uniref:Peptidase M10 serralysin C-terminal domain-containing protein n=1 Tax=Pseudoponticoccus marisrubri TaxID=1685382 RepID=A0A0W7WEP6_9RHOB|nr:calcium-binding protein [Pseudoponticoccus marisrubri]KUF08951.1 hypothetical protein AVJ23_19865 [Pseudoponticoccus marisrubri]